MKYNKCCNFACFIRTTFYNEWSLRMIACAELHVIANEIMVFILSGSASRQLKVRYIVPIDYSDQFMMLITGFVGMYMYVMLENLLHFQFYL